MNQNIVFSYNEIIKGIEAFFNDCPDVIRRKVYLKDGVEGYFLFVEELVDFSLIQRDFIPHILFMSSKELCNESTVRALPVSNVKFYYDANSIFDKILTGEIIFIFDGMLFAISCVLRKFERRSIEEPTVEKNLKGSHEGFVETLNTNIAILRRRIKNNNLKFKMISIGTSTNQTAAIAYIDGIANPDLLNDLYNKIKNIDFDGLLGIGYIEQLISSSPNSPFPQFLSTERPDKTTAMLLEGRFAVLLDGTPVATIAPVSLFSFFQASDDYNFNWLSGTFLRILREVAMLTALFLPGLYVALTSFHYYMVPLRLLIPLAESRARVPFPPYLEALIMEIVIELIREASVRLPTYIGSTIGIIGGIVIGQAAVQAGIVSVLMIIVVSITAIASYTTPMADMGFAIRIYRFIIMAASATYGIIGMIVFFILLVAHLLSLESLGQPYVSPVIPFKFKDLKDVFIRMPIKYLKKRPDISKPVDKERGKNDK